MLLPLRRGIAAVLTPLVLTVTTAGGAAAASPATAGAAGPGADARTSVSAPSAMGWAPVLTLRPLRGAVRMNPGIGQDTYRVLRSADGGPEVEVARDVQGYWTDTGVTEGVTYTYRVVPTFDGVDGVVSNAVTTSPLPMPRGSAGTYVPVTPVRVLDTRDGTGTVTGRLGPGATLQLDPASTGDLPPTGVSAVLLNVTGTQPSAVTHLRVWPAGLGLPQTSSLNLRPGQTRPNQVVVPLGADGKVAVFNNAGSTDVVVDLQGYYSTEGGPRGGGYYPMYPERLMDTRLDEWPLEPEESVWVPVSARDPLTGVEVDWDQVAAVDVNLTVTEPTAHGHLTAWAGDVEPPDVSNANFAPDQTVANHAVVPVSFDEDGEPGIVVRNSAGSTHVIVDLQGWYDRDAQPASLRFEPTPARRVFDTRTSGTRERVVPDGGITVPQSVLPPAAAHVVNVTATDGQGWGHVAVYSGDKYPWTSTVNFSPGEDSPGLATPRVLHDGAVGITVGSAPVHLVVDHVGLFY